MTYNLEHLRRKIEASQDLQSIVKTMKSLAAVSINQYEKAVISLSHYENTLAMAVQILLKSNPQFFREKLSAIKPYIAIVIFGSDQGMCGQFNEKIELFTLEYLQKLAIDKNQCTILTLGNRLKDSLEAAGYTSEKFLSLPSSLEGITPTIQETVLTLESWRKEKTISQILVFYNHPLSRSVYRPSCEQIFPLNIAWLQKLQKKPWTSSSLPIYTMSTEKLASSIFRQYFFVSLYRACAESLAGENASRLASMQVAEKNIWEHLQQLRQQFTHQRQTIITEELLEIVSGFEAINSNILTNSCH